MELCTAAICLKIAFRPRRFDAVYELTSHFFRWHVVVALARQRVRDDLVNLLSTGGSFHRFTFPISVTLR